MLVSRGVRFAPRTMTRAALRLRRSISAMVGINLRTLWHSVGRGVRGSLRIAGKFICCDIVTQTPPVRCIDPLLSPFADFAIRSQNQMNNLTSSRSALPYRYLCCAVRIAPFAAALAFVNVTTAAESASAQNKNLATSEVVSLQNFVVTGSNIQRTDLEKVVPITVLDQDAMTVRNALLPVDMLTTLPSVVNLPENETRLGSSGARGDNANINLRNMGATATLVLVNGRRMTINPMTAGLSQAVNVNQLPTQGVD